MNVTLSHPFLNHLCFFQAEYLEDFFRLNAYDTNAIKGDKIKVLAYFDKINNEMTSDEPSSYVYFLTFMYIISFPTYSVSVSQLTRTLRTEGFHHPTNIIHVSLIFHFNSNYNHRISKSVVFLHWLILNNANLI